MYEALGSALSEFSTRELSWTRLLHDAEQQGIAPLLQKHLSKLGYPLPDGFRRNLRSLYLRNRQSNIIRNREVAELLGCYHQENIDTILVKGIALCNFVYSSSELRPMRDIDILVRKEHLSRAHDILIDLGYQPEKTDSVPDDYYHLVPLRKIIDGLPISIELHHNLLPLDQGYPLWPLDKSYFSARRIDVGDQHGSTLNLEESLWYIYLHGFRPPLTYEPFRFVHVADIVSLVEKYYTEIDWEKIRTEFPSIHTILSRFHYITPWKDHIIDGLKLDISNPPNKPGIGFHGWPQRRLKTVPNSELVLLLKETIFPSQWWVQIYYGQLQGLTYTKARYFDHPRAIWRWIKTYIRAYFRKPSAGCNYSRKD